jgi:hypothetical protein
MTARKPADPVRHYLIERGVRTDLVDDGLAGLVERWARIVEEVARGYQLTLDDYVNDMDIRDIIGGALAVAPPAGREAIEAALASADQKLLAATIPSPSLQNLEDPENSWNPENPPSPDRWWYARRPRRAGPTLTADLARLSGE